MATSRGGFADQSALMDGDIYKIRISQPGVHKLSFDFLKNELGIPIENIDPRKIQILGNTGGALPALAGAARNDDVSGWRSTSGCL